jgi:hypothetical protein
MQQSAGNDMNNPQDGFPKKLTRQELKKQSKLKNRTWSALLEISKESAPKKDWRAKHEAKTKKKLSGEGLLL